MKILGVSRRNLLTGTAASALSFLPFTRKLVSTAYGQTSGPRVLVTLYHPFGVEEGAFYPQGGETLTTFPDGSRPLQEIKNDVLMFRNLNNLAGENAKCGSGYDQHVAGVQTIWTAAKLKVGSGSFRNVSTTASIDQVVGNHLKAKYKTRFNTFNFGVRCVVNAVGVTNWDQNGQAMTFANDPLAAYASLFGDGVAKPVVSTDDLARRMMLRKSLLDDVTADARNFEKALGGSERVAFGSHLNALREFETNLADFAAEAQPKNTCTTIPDRAKFTVAAGSVDVHKTADIQGQLLVLALSCGVTNVATLNITSGFGASYRVPKVVHNVGEGPFDGHELSHDEYANSREAKINFNHLHARTFVAIANGLKNAASPQGGNLFDNAIMLWGSCISGRGGGGHTRVKIPFVVAAGKNSGFATGRIIEAGGRGHGQILLSTCQAFGMDLKTFGDPTYCPGPMTAMNTPGPMPAFNRPAGGFGCQGT